ncbi:hypothetical protein [Dysgonomonas alginatilytica]|nr:hypothetical protein [Dysgonomonas alginatilytica]
MPVISRTLFFLLSISFGIPLNSCINQFKVEADRKTTQQKDSLDFTIELLDLESDTYLSGEYMDFGYMYTDAYMGGDSARQIPILTPIAMDGKWIYETYIYNKDDQKEYIYYNDRGEVIKKNAFKNIKDADDYTYDNISYALKKGKNIHGEYIYYNLDNYDKESDNDNSRVNFYRFDFDNGINKGIFYGIDRKDFYQSAYSEFDGTSIKKNDSEFISQLIKKYLPPFAIESIKKPLEKDFGKSDAEILKFERALINYDHRIDSIYEIYLTNLIKNSKKDSYFHTTHGHFSKESYYNNSTCDDCFLIFDKIGIALNIESFTKNREPILVDIPVYITPEADPITKIPDGVSLNEISKDFIGIEGGRGRGNIGVDLKYIHDYELVCNQDTFQIQNINELELQNAHKIDDNNYIIILSLAYDKCIFFKYHKKEGI